MSLLGMVCPLISGCVLNRRVGPGALFRNKRDFLNHRARLTRLAQLRVRCLRAWEPSLAKSLAGRCWTAIVGFLHQPVKRSGEGRACAAWGVLCCESNYCSVLIERGEAFNQGFSLLLSAETLHSVGLFTGIRWLSGSIVTGDVYG